MKLFKNKATNIISKKNITNRTSDYFDSTAHKRKSWLNKAQAFHKEDALMIKELIMPGSKVLELGCGNGQLLSRLEPKLGIGIDISGNLINEAKKDFPNLTFLKGDIANASKLLNKYSIPDLEFEFDNKLLIDNAEIFRKKFVNLHTHEVKKENYDIIMENYYTNIQKINYNNFENQFSLLINFLSKKY